jgi:hypothetical protein
MLEYDDIATDIVNQLKEQQSSEQFTQPPQTLTTDELEQFLLTNAATLIRDSVQTVGELRTQIGPGSDPKELTGFAEIIKATSQALESLNRVYVTREKNKSAKEIKQMDIDSKQKIVEDINNTRILMNREDLLKQLIENTLSDGEDIIDVNVVKVTD